MSSPNAALKALEGISCGQLLTERGRSAVIIPADATVMDACKILASNEIQSAPVYSKADHSFLGFFDYAMCVNSS